MTELEKGTQLVDQSSGVVMKISDVITVDKEGATEQRYVVGAYAHTKAQILEHFFVVVSD